MHDLDFLKNHTDQIRRVINEVLSSYAEVEINKELLEEEGDLEDLPREDLDDVETLIGGIEGIDEIPQRVVNLVKTYLRNTETLKDHIRDIATTNDGELEPLLTDLVLLYTRDFIEEKEDYPVSSDWCFESTNPQKLDFLWDVYRQTEEVNLKASLVRGMSLLAPRNGFVENLVISTLRQRNLKRNLKWIIYYEFLQNRVDDFVANPWEGKRFLKILEEAKREFPNDDMFYEIDGHIGAHFLLNGDKEQAKRYLSKFYDWIVYRHLADIKPVNLTLNSITFLTKYGELLIDEGDTEGAKKVLETAEGLIRKYRKRFYEESPEIYHIYLEELEEVKRELEEN